MTKDTIVQFIGFVTRLNLDEFAETWRHYTKLFKTKPGQSKLYEAEGKTGTKFKFISQHSCHSDDFRFDFIKGRNSEHFPEKTARVILMGGYVPLQVQYEGKEQRKEVKLIAFLDEHENDLDFYKTLPCHYLNIYQAYYENCNYSYILEYFVSVDGATELAAQLKQRHRVELAIVKECQLKVSV